MRSALISVRTNPNRLQPALLPAGYAPYIQHRRRRLPEYCQKSCAGYRGCIHHHVISTISIRHSPWPSRSRRGRRQESAQASCRCQGQYASYIRTMPENKWPQASERISPDLNRTRLPGKPARSTGDEASGRFPILKIDHRLLRRAVVTKSPGPVRTACTGFPGVQ